MTTTRERWLEAKARARRRDLLELCWRMPDGEGHLVECDIHRVAGGLEVRACQSGGPLISARVVRDLEEAHRVAAAWQHEIAATGGLGHDPA